MREIASAVCGCVQYGNVGAAFASQGFVSVVVSYRLSNPSLRMVSLLMAVIAGAFNVWCAWGRVTLIARVAGIITAACAGSGIYMFAPNWAGGIVMFLVLFLGLIALRASCFRKGAVQYPVHVEDCCLALRWVADNITKMNGDPTRIILSGHSAGVCARVRTVFRSLAWVPSQTLLQGRTLWP